MSPANKNTDELILNWTNTIRGAPAGERMVISELANQYHRRGFSRQESLDMLLSDGYDAEVAGKAVTALYPGEAAKQPVRYAMVTPTSYRDVRPLVDSAFDRLGHEEFINALTLAARPIIKTSKKGLLSWYRLAEQAANDPAAREFLHEEISPYISETMYHSVLLAENTPAEIRRLANANDLFLVETKYEAPVTVDLAEATSTGERFIGGRFSEFGIADEHLVRVAQMVSPYERLQRAIRAS